MEGNWGSLMFPAIRGNQAAHEYYAAMVPLRYLPRLFSFDGDDLSPELRAQRVLNKGRIPEMTRYILDNPGEYVFSALTASLDGEMTFHPHVAEGAASNLGTLEVGMGARLLLNDGQHRWAAITAALEQNSDLQDETIAVVFYRDLGLSRSQQMFADLNRHAVRPSKSLGVLYDQRDDRAQLVRQFVLQSDFFRPLVERERSTLAARSRKLFTLSALYSATKVLLPGLPEGTVTEQAEHVQRFWEALASHFVEWRMVRENRLSAGDVRQESIHTHGVVLQALGVVGKALFQRHPEDWESRLEALETIDWSRSNAAYWEGRTTTAGRVRKGQDNVTLTANIIKKHLGLPLSPDEARMEAKFERRRAR